MGIHFHPEPGTILICDFKGLCAPEMTKRRPVVVVSPKFKHRHKLCTVVPLSTSAPIRIERYHYKLDLHPCLPRPYDAGYAWVKADMLYTMAFERLFLLQDKASSIPGGQRQYQRRSVDAQDFVHIQRCIIAGLGLAI